MRFARFFGSGPLGADKRAVDFVLEDWRPQVLGMADAFAETYTLQECGKIVTDRVQARKRELRTTVPRSAK
jgi:hypothetical protein